MRLVVSTLTVTFVCLWFAGQAQAEHRYDRMMHRHADAIEDSADELYREVIRHFNRRHDFGRLRHIARTIEIKTDHIKRIVDRHESPRHIRADLEEIDRQVHAFEDIVRRSDRHAAHYGERHCERRHVHEELHHLTEMIHAMRDHMDCSVRPVHPVRPVRPVAVPVHRPRPVVYHDYPRHGISFGGHWGRVHFRF